MCDIITIMTDSLKLAAEDGELNEVKKLIEQQNIPINQPDEFGDTALHAAVAKGRLGMHTHHHSSNNTI